MHRTATAIFGVGVLALSTGCRKETPIDRAKRICNEQGSQALDKGSTTAKLDQLGDAAACSVGPIACETDRGSADCREFLERYP